MMDSVFANDVHGDRIEIRIGDIFNVETANGRLQYQYLGETECAEGSAIYLLCITTSKWENVPHSWLEKKKIWTD